MRYLYLVIILLSLSFAGCIDKDVTGKVTVRYTDDAALPPDTGAVMGTVRSQDGTPLLNAKVTLEGEESFERETGTMGAFTYTDIQPGKYAISARRWDYRILSTDIEVKAGKAANVVFILTASVGSE
ncbi:MAG: carboxypeptidase regulatory-like domain-containing protein [bacterium]|nr:carboxypeptidase regulatory-like domain-containing protein [bacterium]